MLDKKFFRYVVVKANNVTETKEAHRTMTLTEAFSWFSALLEDIPDDFIGELAIIYKPKDQKIFHFVISKEGLNLTMNKDLLPQTGKEYLAVGEFVMRFMDTEEEKDV